MMKTTTMTTIARPILRRFPSQMTPRPLRVHLCAPLAVLTAVEADRLRRLAPRAKAEEDLRRALRPRKRRQQARTRGAHRMAPKFLNRHSHSHSRLKSVREGKGTCWPINRRGRWYCWWRKVTTSLFGPRTLEARRGGPPFRSLRPTSSGSGQLALSTRAPCRTAGHRRAVCLCATHRRLGPPAAYAQASYPRASGPPPRGSAA